MRPWRFMVALAVLVMLTGCKTAATALPEDHGLDRLTLSAEAKNKLPLTVAVLPFENLTDRPEAADLLRQSFYNHFAAKRYRDLEPARIDTRLGQASLMQDRAFLAQPPGKLGELLGARGLVYGRVHELARTYLGAASRVCADLSVRLVDASSGKELWHARHKFCQNDGDLPLSILGVLPALIRNALNMRQIVLVRTADDLCRELVAPLPEPAAGELTRPPAITLVAHDGGDSWHRAGDEIHIVLTGTPGLSATADIGTMAESLPMSEGPEGVYTARYRVRPEDGEAVARVTGHLTDANGNRADWGDPLAPLRIDTRPPPRPEELSAAGRDGEVVLKWHGSAVGDLHHYVLYQSRTPLDGFAPLAETEFAHYRDSGLENNRLYFYKVAAVDRAGNVGDAAGPERAVPVAPGPVAVRDAVVDDTAWYAGAGPYLLKAEVVVANGAVLTIEPGTVVRSAGPGLRIAGALVARGRADDPVRFEADGDSAWAGLIFDNTHDAASVLDHCVIRGADAAVTVIASSPVVSNATLTQNKNGLVIEALSEPSIKANRIVENRETAIRISGARPEISGNAIRDNGSGILCDGGSPKIFGNAIWKNSDFNLANQGKEGEILDVGANWWGSIDGTRIVSKLRGLVQVKAVLDAAPPEGKKIAVSGLEGLDWRAELEKIENFIQRGRTETAEARLHRLIAFRPETARAHFLLGLVFQARGRGEAAIAALERAAALEPENANTRLVLGLAYSGAGQREKARKQWQQALDIDPDSTRARQLLDLLPPEEKTQ